MLGAVDAQPLHTKEVEEDAEELWGNIVMLRYAGHFKDDFYLASVSVVHPDDKGLVRVVTIQFRKRNRRE